MSGSAAISRAKARRGTVGNETPMSSSDTGNVNKKPQREIEPDQLILEHDLKLFIFEKKITELHEMITKPSKTDNGIPNTVNENMLSEALESLDSRLDNLESNNTSGNFSKQIEKLEQEQKELKSLLLKIQNMTMETSLKLMQLRDKPLSEVKASNNTLENTQDLTNEVLDVSLSEDNRDAKKKGKK